MSAFFFVPLLAISWIVGFAVAAHASHYFLTIIESTATGMARNLSWKGRPFREWIRDGVQWPDDLFIDYFAKTFYFAYIVGIWIVPAFLAGRLLAGRTPWATVIACSVFWLLFPIGLLSSLASHTRWTPFWSGILVAFICRPGKVFAFYLLSAPVLGILVFTLDLILIHSESMEIGWQLALCPIAVVCFFIYARLLGRLGLIVSFTRPEVERKPRQRVRKKKRPLHAYDMTTRVFVPKEEIHDVPMNTQPTDLPPLETPYDGPVHGYTVDYAGTSPLIEEPKPAPKIMHFDDDDLTPITVAPPPDVSGTDREKLAAKLATPSDREMELYLRERPTEPKNPYGAEAVTFLFDPKTIDPFTRLTLGLMVMAILQRALDMLRPI
jgi:hypothetical protein